MERTINAVDLIKTIANKLRDKKLKNISSVEKEIAALGEYLGTDLMQTVIFVAIFDRTSSGSIRTFVQKVKESPHPALQRSGCHLRQAYGANIQQRR